MDWRYVTEQAKSLIWQMTAFQGLGICSGIAQFIDAGTNKCQSPHIRLVDMLHSKRERGRRKTRHSWSTGPWEKKRHNLACWWDKTDLSQCGASSGAALAAALLLSSATALKHCKQHHAKEKAVLCRVCVQRRKWGMTNDPQIVLFCYWLLVLHLNTL